MDKRRDSARDGARTAALAAFVGVGTGGVAAAFLKLYEAATFWPALGRRAAWGPWTLGPVWLVALPALGGLLCGLIIDHVEPAAAGTGTPELLHALRAGGTPVRARYAAWKTVASVFTTCTGGSAGPEAPMVTFGAGLAHWVSRRVGAAEGSEKTLAAAGAAAGFAAVFDAPAAGVAFAIEVLLRDFSPLPLAAVALAAAVGAASADALMGPRPWLAGLAAGSWDWRALPLMALVGAAAGLLGKAFIETALWTGKLMEKAAPRHAARAALGGLLVGALGLFVPQALGNSHPDLPVLLGAAPAAWTTLLLLLAGKALACELTVGSGGSGGIFIPYLYLGGILGALAWIAAAAAPAWAGTAGASMVAGMSAVFAAITLAPVTAVVLALELTRAWPAAPGVIVATAAATLVSRAIDPESLDTRKLLKKGVRLRQAQARART